MAHHTFALTAEYIELDKLLKLLSIASSGGAAKAMVAEGMVRVDGEPETRKTRKLRAGSVIEVDLGGEQVETVRVLQEGMTKTEHGRPQGRRDHGGQ